jgi:hypothetical protein
MKNKCIYLISIILLFSIVNVSALNNQPNVPVGQTTQVCQPCADATYILFSQVITPNSTDSINQSVSLSNGVGCINYTFIQSGRYDFMGTSDGCEKTFAFTRNAGSSDLTFFIILMCLAVVFFLASLFVSEEFFIYISGVLFLISGIYLMINGINTSYDWASQGLAMVLIGVGLLFSVGAYIFNSYKSDSTEDTYD